MGGAGPRNLRHRHEGSRAFRSGRSQFYDRTCKPRSCARYTDKTFSAQRGDINAKWPGSAHVWLLHVQLIVTDSDSGSSVTVFTLSLGQEAPAHAPVRMHERFPHDTSASRTNFISIRATLTRRRGAGAVRGGDSVDRAPIV